MFFLVNGNLTGNKAIGRELFVSSPYQASVVSETDPANTVRKIFEHLVLTI